MTYSATRLLCVDDSADDVELIALALEREAPQRSWEVRRVEDAAGFVAAFQDPVDLVLCESQLARFSASEALQMLHGLGDPAPLLVFTRSLGEPAVVDLLRQGARDCVTKDRPATLLLQVIDRALAERRQQRLAADFSTAHERLRQMSSRLVAEQEDERSRLARELHDQVGQALAGMMLHLHASQLLAEPARARTHANLAIGIAQDVVDQLKALSFSLRPAQLDLLGLPTTLETAVQQLAEPAGATWSVRTRGMQEGDLGGRAPLALRVVREAVRHAVDDAGARAVNVRLRFLPGGHLGLAIAACGAQAGVAPSPVLQALRDRCELLGGSLRMRGCDNNRATTRAML